MGIGILIVGGKILFRAALRALLESVAGLIVLAEASDIDETVRMADQLEPDVILMDTSTHDGCLIQTIRQIKAGYATGRIIILAGYEYDRLLHEAITAGISGYIIMDAKGTELFNAIQAVMRGELYIHPSMTRNLLNNQLTLRMPDDGHATGLLTRREMEVIRLIAGGFSNRQIAGKLFVSVRTIETHRANISDKLNLRGRSELVNYFMNNCLRKGEKRDLGNESLHKNSP